jgi:fructose-1,6-bisphosphatase-3
VTAATAHHELALLESLALRFPTTEAALAEAAALRATLSLPKGVVHVVSDVHGEFKKLDHVINNTSGTLRPLVESLFRDRLTNEELRELLATLYYPRELLEHLAPDLAEPERRLAFVGRTLRLQFEVVRKLASRYPRHRLLELADADYRHLFEELLAEPWIGRGTAYIDAMLDTLRARDRDFGAVHAASHLVRNLSVHEIVVAGDLGDRGPRIDRVIETLLEQPNVSITWGNHDVSWLGACLGQEALIATVLRVSLRYRRLSQLEEGYGIIVSPLERLARTVYDDDPAERFQTRGTGLRDDLLMARMQKAAAILQFKLEGQTSRRHPEWDLEGRNLLHRISVKAGSVEIDCVTHPLRDTFLPTLDPADPYALSAEERVCMDRLRESFLASERLARHMSFVVRRGAMYLVRDRALIFHGCMPVDADGAPLALKVDGVEHRGGSLFDALDAVVRRAFREGAGHAGEDADWFWYLWTGPCSPLFGKDRMATFESYFVEDESARVETKNPYFKLMHDAEFCRGVAEEMGVDRDVLLVNGHVPVRVDKGEKPVKRGGNAVTIDGAFSEAYGDRGYTLLLEPERTALAEHCHFESVREAITHGADIIPEVSTLREHSPPRLIGDTEEGSAVRERIAALERLVDAYDQGLLEEQIR